VPGSQLKMWRLPIYPWLLGLVPILHLYTVNFGSVIDREALICIFWLMLTTSIGFAAINFVFRDRHQTALILSFIVLAFSLSGHILDLLSENEPLIVWTISVLIVLATVIAELQKAGYADYVRQAVFPLNLIAMTMIFMQLAAIFSQRFDATIDLGEHLRHQGLTDADESRTTVLDSNDRPDIYYIVPDGYPSDAWLKSEMNYDNSAFTEALEARGFVVARQTQANYGLTLASLASTLNMRYVDSNPTKLRDQDYLRLIISDSAVARHLKQLGYSFVQLLSGFFIPSAIADINRDFTPSGTTDILVDRASLSVALQADDQNLQLNTDIGLFYKRSFVSLYLDTTLIRLFAKQLEAFIFGSSVGSYDMLAPQRFLATIDEIPAIASMPEATFTFVHLLKPHFPTVFDERGDIIGPINKPSHRQYFAEFKFTNSKFLEMIDTILAVSRHPPIIIFQADHGSTYGATRVQLERRRYLHFDAYAAYYLPERFQLQIPRVHTSVNTFPLLFNAVFDSGFEFRDNRLFEVLIGNGAPFEQVDVTDIYARWQD